MSLDADDLKTLLEQDDVEKCVSFFAGATDSERRRWRRSPRIDCVRSQSTIGSMTILNAAAQLAAEE